MARPTGLSEMLAAVAFDLAKRDHVGLADQARPKAAGLHLVAKGRSRQPETGGGLAKGQHRSVVRGGEILRRVVRQPSSLEFGVGCPKPSGRLDAVPEWRAWYQAIQSDLGHAHRRLGRIEPFSCVEQRLKVRRLGRHGSAVLSGPVGRVHADNIADIGHDCKRRNRQSTEHPRPMGGVPVDRAEKLDG